MKTCKRPLGRGADDGATVKGSSCDKERGALVEPRTVRLVVIDGSGAGAGVGVDINIIIRFLEFAVFVLQLVQRFGLSCYTKYICLVRFCPPVHHVGP